MLRVSYVFAMVIAAGVSVAHADDNRDKALKLFEDSGKAYKSGKFEQAADLLRKAYDLYPEPLLLYNLGRAQEGLGDPRGAIESYERYLKEAKQVDDRGAIERRIETLKAQIEKEEADAKRRAEDERRLKEEQERRAREPVDDRTPLEKWGPWAAMGTGGTFILTGLVFGVRSDSKHDDAIAANIQVDAANLQASAERYATIANVMFVVGGVAAAGGIAWKVWQWQHPRAQTTGAQLQVAPNGVGLEWVFP